jgi:hypothetical protein
MNCRATAKMARRRPSLAPAFLLIEALVYMSVLVVLLAVGYAALYRAMDNSIALRHNADDIASALRSGERWRADLRSATGEIQSETAPGEQVIRVPSGRGEITYRFVTNAVLRRVGDGPWAGLLDNVKISVMRPDPRRQVTAWRWELELETRRKTTTRIRPLFTFVAVPPNHS